jgi:hypothetical protein
MSNEEIESQVDDILQESEIIYISPNEILKKDTFEAILIITEKSIVDDFMTD